MAFHDYNISEHHQTNYIGTHDSPADLRVAYVLTAFNAGSAGLLTQEDQFS